MALLLIASLIGCRQPSESSSGAAAEESSAMQSIASAAATGSETTASSKAETASASSKTSSGDDFDETLSMAEDLMSILSELDDITSSGIVVPNS